MYILITCIVLVATHTLWAQEAPETFSEPAQALTKIQIPHPAQEKPTKAALPPVPTLPAMTIKMVNKKPEITLCASLPLSGEISIAGQQVLDGMSLVCNLIKKGKINVPFSLKLYPENDNNDVPKIRKNIKKMMSSSPLFISFFGTESMQALAEKINQQKIVSFFPLDGSLAFRTQELPNVIFFRAAFDQEVRALIHYTVEHLTKKKFAIFHEASDWGEETCQDAKAVLKERGITELVTASYQAGTVNITQAVDAIAGKAPNAIICIAQARPAYNFIRQMINKGLIQTTFLGTSTLFATQEPLKKSRGINVITASVVPDPAKSKLEIVQEFKKWMRTELSNKPLTPFVLEGYINAMLLVHALSKCTQPYTTEKLMANLQALSGTIFKGLRLLFDPVTRTLSHDIWINLGDSTEWELFDSEKEE